MAALRPCIIASGSAEVRRGDPWLTLMFSMFALETALVFQMVEPHVASLPHEVAGYELRPAGAAIQSQVEGLV